MPYFITRVELHAAQKDDYEKLHAEMAKEKFSRTITASGGTIYDLPTASYCKIGEFTTTQVLDSAKKAATLVGKSYEVLVTQAAVIGSTNAITWYNLREHK
jgi:hypothetical protein